MLGYKALVLQTQETTALNGGSVLPKRIRVAIESPPSSTLCVIVRHTVWRPQRKARVQIDCPDPHHVPYVRNGMDLPKDRPSITSQQTHGEGQTLNRIPADLLKQATDPSKSQTKNSMVSHRCHTIRDLPVQRKYVCPHLYCAKQCRL
jgi:hypothetical protein